MKKVGALKEHIILVFLSDLSKFSSAKQITAFVGLNPKQTQSGASVNGRTRLSKTGHREIRKNQKRTQKQGRRKVRLRKGCRNVEKTGG